MAVEIALDDQEVKQRMNQLAPLQAPQGVQPEQGALSQFQDMAKQRVMEKSLDAADDMVVSGVKGLMQPTTAAPTQAAITNAASTTGTAAPLMQNVMGQAGAGAGIGAAMPYIGAGLLAGKAFGLFNHGGMVGPLAKIEYKSKGGDVYKLSYGGPISKGA